VRFNNNADPFTTSLNANFWTYAADDVALTAMALVARLRKFSPAIIKRNSKAKVMAFLELQNNHFTLAPSLLRQFAFANSCIPQKIEDMSDAYKAIAKADIVLENPKFYNKIISEPDTNIQEKHNLQFFNTIKNSAIEFMSESSSSFSSSPSH